jgi:hypothetical protein
MGKEASMLRGAVIFVLLISVYSSLPFTVLAQDEKTPDDKLNYILLQATRRRASDDPQGKQIIVEFSTSFPEDEPLSKDPQTGQKREEYDADGGFLGAAHWIVRAIDLETGAGADLPVDSVLVLPFEQLVVLTLRDPIPSNHKIVIVFRQSNFPTVTLGQPKKTGVSGAFTAAKGKDDADIYFKGSAIGARESKPLYVFETKLGYMHRINRSNPQWGDIGGRATANAAEESNADPDSITAKVVYENIVVFGAAKGLIIKADFGGEFDSKSRTRNMVAGLDATFVLPSKPIGETNFATMDFQFGFEGGHNYRHKLDEEGLGRFWRWKMGTSAYFVALNPGLFARINLNTGYTVRLPRSAEPFTEIVNGEEVTALRKRARHFVGTDLDFMFNDAFGITIGHRYGSLPPAFKLVNNSVSIGLKVQLKQVNR